MNAIYQDLINFFGNQSKTAQALGIKQTNISWYLTGKSNMSEKVAIRAEIATGGRFKAIDLCPSLKEFAELYQNPQENKTPSGH